MNSFKSTLYALTFALGMGATAPVYAQERQIDPARQIDQMLDYTTFLGEKIEKVREIKQKYDAQPRVDTINKRDRAVRQAKNAIHELRELPLAEPTDESDPLEKQLAGYRVKRDAAEERALFKEKVKRPFHVAYNPMTCTASLDYDQDLTEIAQAYHAQRIKVIRQNPETIEADLVLKMENMLSELLNETTTRVNAFNSEHQCGGN
jgi:acetolactate synthase small subunit